MKGLGAMLGRGGGLGGLLGGGGAMPGGGAGGIPGLPPGIFGKK
jgi:signal recognition particle subunit SRP54